MTMKHSVKDILLKNWKFLLKNVVPCESLYGHLEKSKVLTPTMKNSIKEKQSVKEKNETLLHCLEIKDIKDLEHFCDALQASGHNLVADALRNDLSEEDFESKGLENLFKKLGKNNISDEEKEKLKQLIAEHVKDSIFQYELKSSALDKDRAQDAKRLQMEERWHFEEVVKEKDQMIKGVENSLHEALREAESKGVKLRDFDSYINQLKEQHDTAMKTQVKFNVANDNSLRRMTEREQHTENALIEMNDQISTRLKKDPEVKHMRVKSASSVSTNEAAITVLDQTRDNLNKLFHKVSHLEDIKDKYNSVMEERFYILSHLGQAESFPLREAFQNHIVTIDDAFTKLKQEKSELHSEIQSLKEKIEELQNQLNETPEIDPLKFSELETQVEKLTSHLKTKDLRVNTLTRENKDLQKQLSKGPQGHLPYKGTNYSKRPPSPSFRDYVDTAVETPPPKSPLKSTKVTKPFVMRVMEEDAALRRDGPTRSSDRSQTSVSFPPIYQKSAPRIDVRPQHPGVASIPKHAPQLTAKTSHAPVKAQQFYSGRSILGSRQRARADNNNQILTVNSILPQKGNVQFSSYQDTYGRQQSVEIQKRDSLV